MPREQCQLLYEMHRCDATVLEGYYRQLKEAELAGAGGDQSPEAMFEEVVTRYKAELAVIEEEERLEEERLLAEEKRHIQMGHWPKGYVDKEEDWVAVLPGQPIFSRRAESKVLPNEEVEKLESADLSSTPKSKNAAVIKSPLRLPNEYLFNLIASTAAGPSSVTFRS